MKTGRLLAVLLASLGATTRVHAQTQPVVSASPPSTPFTLQGPPATSTQGGSSAFSTPVPFTFQGGMGGANAQPSLFGTGAATAGLNGLGGHLSGLAPTPFTFEESIYRPLAVPNFIPAVPLGTPPVFSLQAKIGETFEYDDNPLLMTTPPKTLMGSVTAPEFLISGGSLDTTANLDTKLDINTFNLAGFSSVDLHANGGVSIDRDRFLASLSGSLDYDTTRTSELTLSGINIVGIHHTGFTLSPEFGYRVSPIDQLILDGSFSQNTYPDAAIFTSFRTYTFRPSFVHSLDPNNALIGFVGLQKYNTINRVPTDIVSVLPGVGWNGQLNPRLTASADAGLNETRIRVFGVSGPISTGYTYDFKLTYGSAEARNHLIGSISHNLTPVASGVELTQTSLELQEQYQFSPRLSANVSFVYQTNQQPDAASYVQKTYLSAAVEASYALTEHLSLNGTFRYRNREFFLNARAAASNAVLFSIVFSPSRFSIGL